MSEDMKEEQEQEFIPYDLDLWRMHVRNQRKKMGYDKATHFVQTLWLRTRIKINVQTFYKIEQGKQEPSITQFMAINLALFNNEIPSHDIHNHCMCEEWKEVKELTNNPNTDDLTDYLIVPSKWAIENYEKMKEQYEVADTDNSLFFVAVKANEPTELFEKLPF